MNETARPEKGAAHRAHAATAWRRVLVPHETWPSYECLEHNGTGWEALIEKVARGNARVRFLYATTARGVRYAESDLELSVLRPL